MSKRSENKGQRLAFANLFFDAQNNFVKSLKKEANFKQIRQIILEQFDDENVIFWRVCLIVTFLDKEVFTL